MTKLTRDNFREFYSPIQFLGGHCNFTLRGIVKEIEGEVEASFPPINMDPPYQRGHVWTVQQQERFVGHFLEGGAVPDIIMRRDPAFSGMTPDEVVDGKQRLTALYRWVKGEIDAELTDGRRCNINDFDAQSQKSITGNAGPMVSIQYGYWTDAEVLRLYIRLNRGGTVHTDEEINRVRELLREAEEE